MAMEAPDGEPFEEFTTHERRSYLCNRIFEAGSPHALTQSREAERFDVHQSTISRDMDRIRESVDGHIGRSAKLRTASMLEWLTDELQDADDWRAKAALFDRVMRFNEWLADIGEQDREPRRSELDVDLERRSREISYTVVTGDGEELLGDGGEEEPTAAEQEDLGFTSTPAEVDVETPGGDDE